MEQSPSVEKVSYLSLDTYLEFVSGLNTIDGKLIEDETHTFYVWVTSTYPSFQNIDAVSLLSIIERVYNRPEGKGKPDKVVGNRSNQIVG